MYNFKTFYGKCQIIKKTERHLLFLFRNISEFFLILLPEERIKKNFLKYYEIKIIKYFSVIYVYICIYS